MTEINFENGSKIECIESNEKILSVDVARSKRYEEALKKAKENPLDFFIESQNIKLHTYQKVLLKMMITKDKIVNYIMPYRRWR